LTPAKALRENRAGRLVRLAQGVYCDEEDLENLPDFMGKNAVRIANFLFPSSVLIHASAYSKGAIESLRTEKGEIRKSPKHRLFIGGAYAKTVELQYLDIIQSYSLKNDRLYQFCTSMQDGLENQLGPLKVRCASDELVFLQNFGRRRYNLDKFLPDEAMMELLARLESTHGSNLPARLRYVSSACDDLKEELGKSLEWLNSPAARIKNDVTEHHIYEFSVNWFRRPVAKLYFNGVGWSFNWEEGWMLPLTCQKTKPLHAPAFLSNLFPEGFALDSIKARMEGGNHHALIMSNSDRYLTNISIVGEGDRARSMPVDVLEGHLPDHTQDGFFRGKLSGVPKVDNRSIPEIRELVSRRDAPRMSGNQAKIPMHLTEGGHMSPATHGPFTHILKLPGIVAEDHKNLRGCVEWASMELARASGVETAEFSMVELPGGIVGYVTERFDIPRSVNEPLIFCEDFCSVLGVGPSEKFFHDIEAVAQALKEHSTDFERDRDQFFRQVVANHFLENGDFHLKNIAMRKVAAPTLDRFQEVRLAPAFDIMCTHFFSKLPKASEEIETMVLDLNGKTGEVYTYEDFVHLARVMDIPVEHANRMMFETATGIVAGAIQIKQSPPKLLAKHPDALEAVLMTCDRAINRCLEAYPVLGQLTSKTEAAADANETKETKDTKKARKRGIS
jgi:hypothetical protein